MSTAAAVVAQKPEISMLDISTIEPDPHNPRKDFPKDKMQELAHSIGLRGVQQPIKVRPIGNGKHRIVFGERRFRASQLAGLKQIPAIVENLTELAAADLQLIENLDREELAALEIAGGYKRQLDLGRTMDQLCERAGKKRSTIYATMQLLQLGTEGRKALGEGQISASVAQLVARLPKALQPDYVKTVLGVRSWNGKETQEEPLSYREAVAEFEKLLRDLKKAPFKLDTKGLACVAESCAVCPKRTGNAKDLYPDAKNPDICTDAPAYDNKVFLFRKAELEKKGLKLLSPKEISVNELFWNTHDGLRPDSGYVEPSNTCSDDAKRRTFAQLLEPEQLKKLTVVAINHAGQPVELLPQAKLKAELKKAGKVQSWEALQKERNKKAKAKEANAVERGPDIDTLQRHALIAKCVAAVEDKGMLTSAMLKLIARGLLAETYALPERRGLPETFNTYSASESEKMFDKHFPKLTPGKLAGLVFECAFDKHIDDGAEVDDLGAAACELLHIDPKKVAADVAMEIEAKKVAERTKEDVERAKAFKADVKKAVANQKSAQAAKKVGGK